MYIKLQEDKINGLTIKLKTIYLNFSTKTIITTICPIKKIYNKI